MDTAFQGIPMGLGGISRLSSAKTRSISAENPYGEKGKGARAVFGGETPEEVERIGQLPSLSHASRDLGRGWKVRPCIQLPPQSETTIMDVEGPGVIQHIWITIGESAYRDCILRMYWDGEEAPSVEVPLGDFFCCGWKTRTKVLSMPINVNPSGGFNSYFPMPFRKHARVTVENRSEGEMNGFFYTINYALCEVGEEEGTFHAQYRRSNPLPYGEVHTLLDGVRGQGQYVGTYMAWQQNAAGWWGEGEFKAYLDGDGEDPTICGTGTEDYFGGAWCFGETFSAPYLGYPLGANGQTENGRVGMRHGLYRFHILDPIRFESDLRVTMQALGWRSEGRYLPLQDDIHSVAYWYQREPHAPFPELGDRDALEII